jgi:hypothetical protein
MMRTKMVSAASIRMITSMTIMSKTPRGLTLESGGASQQSGVQINSLLDWSNP